MEDKEIIIEKNNDESQAEPPPAERERTLGETDPAIAGEFYRNHYSRPGYPWGGKSDCR